MKAAKSSEPLTVFLREARERAGLTQKQVADSLEYSTAQFISSWERGEREPPMHVIHRIARLYRVEASELFEMMLKDRIKQVETAMRAEFQNGKKQKS